MRTDVFFSFLAARIQFLTALETRDQAPRLVLAWRSCHAATFSCPPLDVDVAESFDAARRRRFPESRRVWLPEIEIPAIATCIARQPTVEVCPQNTTRAPLPSFQSGSQPLTAV